MFTIVNASDVLVPAVEFKDCRGVTISAGDKVVVAQRRGSSSWLSFYTVLATNGAKGNRPVYSTKNNRKVTYGGSSDAIVVLL